MKLTPLATTRDPAYPLYRPIWRKLAATVAASAALWLPACGDESCPTRLGGDTQPVEEVRAPGVVPAQQSPTPEVKPPEPPVLPEQPSPRTGGVVRPPTPPQPVEPLPVRPPGQAPAPSPPKHGNG